MTNEEAKMQIQSIPEKIWNQLSEPDREAMEMAFSELEKQIPKKLIAEGDGYADGSIVYDSFYCPSCDHCMKEDEVEDYCPNCGQKICWEYPIDYAATFDMAIEALQAQDATNTEKMQQTYDKSCNNLQPVADDLISRQALINQLDEYVLDETTNMKGDSVREVIESLPSAQPEIIHCKDCKNAKEDALCGGYWCKGKAVTSNHYCGYAERR